MSVIEMIRFILGTVLIIAGMITFLIEIYGIFKMKYVLNRIHAAAMGDTAGFFLCMIGLCIYRGFDMVTLKIGVTIILFWIASPVAAHMTALLESYTNVKIKNHITYEGDLATLEKESDKEKHQN